MFGLNPMSKSKRLIVGILVLLIVDVIWVASSEITEVSHVESLEHFFPFIFYFTLVFCISNTRKLRIIFVK